MLCSLRCLCDSCAVSSKRTGVDCGVVLSEEDPTLGSTFTLFDVDIVSGALTGTAGPLGVSNRNRSNRQSMMSCALA
jgi:hypothetical protein